LKHHQFSTVGSPLEIVMANGKKFLVDVFGRQAVLSGVAKSSWRG